MTDYSLWSRKKIAVTTLQLDTLNPRLPLAKQNLTQNEVITELVKHDNVYALAQNIASAGYFSFEPLVVVKEKHGTVVLEGNRRLAALKLLLNPELASGTEVKKFRTLSEKIHPPITKIDVVVAPNRTQAYSYIRSRHIGNGAVEKWTPIQQARFYADRLEAGTPIEVIAQEDSLNSSEVLKLLRIDKLYALARSMELPDSVRQKVDDPRKFPITTVERLADSPDFRKALGLEQDKNDIFRITLSPDEFKKGYSRVISDVARGKVTSRKHNSNLEIKKYVQTLGPDKPNLRKKDNVTADDIINSGVPQPLRKTRKKVKKKKSTTVGKSILPKELKCTLDDDRVHDIFKELKGLSVATYPNADAILLRSLLEMSMYRYLLDRNLLKDVKTHVTKNRRQSVGRNWVPTLKEMLSYSIKERTIPLDAKANQAITKLLSDRNSPLSIDGMNGFTHNNYLTPTESELRALMTRIRPILEITLSAFEDEGAD